MYLLSKIDNDSLQIWLTELKEFQLDSMFDTAVLARAYLCTNSISIHKNTINSIGAVVGDNKYEIHITSNNDFILGGCSCPFDGKCKHLAALFLVLIVP